MTIAGFTFLPRQGAGGSISTQATTASTPTQPPAVIPDQYNFIKMTLADLQALPLQERQSVIKKFRDSTYMAGQRVKALHSGAPETVQSRTQNLFETGRMIRLLLDMEVSCAGASKNDYETASKNLRRLERYVEQEVETLQGQDIPRSDKADFIRPFFKRAVSANPRSNFFHDPDIRKLYLICKIAHTLHQSFRIVSDEEASYDQRMLTHGLAHGTPSMETFQHLLLHLLSKNGIKLSHVSSMGTHRIVILNKYVLAWGTTNDQPQIALHILSSFTDLNPDAKTGHGSAGAKVLSTRLRNLLFLTGGRSNDLIEYARKLDPQNIIYLQLSAEARAKQGDHHGAFALYQEIADAHATHDGFFRMDLIQATCASITTEDPNKADQAQEILRAFQL